MSGHFLKKLRTNETVSFTTLLTNLSLFIMLLAFFIVLNSHAQFSDERIKPILKSLEETFTVRVFRDDLGPSSKQAADRSTGEGYDSVASMDEYFRSAFPGAKPQMIPSRGTYYVEVGKDQFEKKFFGEKATLQKTIVEKLWAYRPMQMEIWINLQDDPGKASAAGSTQLKDANKLAAAWAGKLQEQGLDQGQLMIGLQKGDPEKVTVLFHNYNPYVPTP